VNLLSGGRSETGVQEPGYKRKEIPMTNSQVRLLSSAIALLAGAVLANTYNIDVNVSISNPDQLNVIYC